MYWVTEKKNLKNPTPNFRALTRLVVLYLQNYTTKICGHYHMNNTWTNLQIVLNTLLKLRHLKKYLPNFLPQKIR